MLLLMFKMFEFTFYLFSHIIASVFPWTEQNRGKKNRKKKKNTKIFSIQNTWMDLLCLVAFFSFLASALCFRILTVWQNDLFGNGKNIEDSTQEDSPTVPQSHIHRYFNLWIWLAVARANTKVSTRIHYNSFVVTCNTRLCNSFIHRNDIMSYIILPDLRQSIHYLHLYELAFNYPAHMHEHRTPLNNMSSIFFFRNYFVLKTLPSVKAFYSN